MLNKLKISAFCNDLEKLKKETYESISYDDFLHLKKIEKRGRICSFLGLATAWIIPNPITAFLISFGHFTRWLLAHHILHKGYNKVPNIPKSYTSKVFARGKNRFKDWFDWLHPDAWDYEHNILHHYHTCEEADPDLVERHLNFCRSLKIPKFLKYIIIFFISITWKYTYYAPNTLSVLDPVRMKKIKHEHIAYITIKNLLDFTNKHVRKLWLSCYIPYFLFNFVLIPFLFFPLGMQAVYFVFINKIIAECFTNFHAFLVIGPNHAGDDVHRFNFHFNDKQEFYITQILGSVNYHCGNDFIDHSQIWLNYQIEHHLFPDLPMSKYQEVQPKVKALCEKHDIPYIQESIFVRFRKMLQICVGSRSMPQLMELKVS